MAPSGEARLLPSPTGEVALGGLLRPSRSAVGAGALLGLLAAGLAVAVGAAAEPSYLVGGSNVAFPDWLAGPLSGLGPGLSKTGFGGLVVFMCACYLAVLGCARSVPARWAMAGIAALHLVFLLAPPLLSPDVFGYIAYERLGALHGVNPYLHGAGAAAADPVVPYIRYPELASPYGPLFTLLGYATAPMGVAGAMWAFKAAAAAASLGLTGLVAACAHRLGRPPVPAALFVGLNPLLLFYGVAGAHNDLTMMALVLLAVYLVLRGGEGLGAAALVGAVGVKATAALFLPFLLLAARRRRRALGVALAAFALLAALAFGVFGTGMLEYLDTLRHHTELVSDHSVPTALGVLVGLGGATLELRLAATGLFAVTLVAMLVRASRPGSAGPPGSPADAHYWIESTGWSALALLATTTWLLPWYVVWVLPFAALGESRRLRLAALALCGLILLIRTLLFGSS